jgi:hypothetical protein
MNVPAGLRLGAVERRILLKAAEGKGEFVFWFNSAAQHDRAWRAAEARARMKLCRAGLLESDLRMNRIQRHHVVRKDRPQDGPYDRQEYTMYSQDFHIRLTELGQRITEAFADELAENKPIRWAKMGGQEG